MNVAMHTHAFSTPTSLPRLIQSSDQICRGDRLCSCALKGSVGEKSHGPKRILSACTAAVAAAALTCLHPRACKSCHNDAMPSLLLDNNSAKELPSEMYSTSCSSSEPNLNCPLAVKQEANETEEDQFLTQSLTSQSVSPTASSHSSLSSAALSPSECLSISVASSSLPVLSSSSKTQSQNNYNSSYAVNAALLSEWAASKTPRRPGSPLARASVSRLRPATLGLVGVGAVTSGSMLLRRAQMRMRSRRQDRSDRDEEILARLHNVCTVVCLQIPFCANDRPSLLRGLERLILTSSCNDAGGMADACRSAASLLQVETGMMEDSRRFAPHIDLFLAESFEEAERRFLAHVTIEGFRLDRLDTSAISEDDGDYGVVTMVVATTEGVDLRCCDDGLTNMQRLRSAIDAISRLKEGEAAGLELLWVPYKIGDRSLSRAQMADLYPNLQIA